MPSELRARRVGDRIAEELAVLLQFEVEDPRLAGLVITGVDVDRELAFATVYVAAYTGEERHDEVLEALEGAKGFLRSQLAKRIELRSFPHLRFRWDASQIRGARIEELLDQIKQERDQRKDSGES